LNPDTKPKSLFDSKALLGTLLNRATDRLSPVPPLTRVGGNMPVPLPDPDSILSASVEVLAEPGNRVLLAALTNGAAVSEELRVLLAKIRVLDEERRLRCLGIVSCMGKEGKTTVSLGLATAIARQPGRRALVIELDLRRPMMESYLGLPREVGVSDYLAGGCDTLPVRYVEPFGFSLVTAGTQVVKPELLISPRMAALIDAAREHYHYVLVDCAPLGPVADAVIIQDLVDGFLLVVRARQTPQQTLLRAAAQLKPDRIRGVIVNGHRELLIRSFSYGYAGYR
jgi:capsular exopolysaccharide synthesis family protein